MGKHGNTERMPLQAGEQRVLRAGDYPASSMDRSSLPTDDRPAPTPDDASERGGGLPRWVRRLIGSVVFVLVMECFVFNLPFWESASFGDGEPCAFTVGSGLVAGENDTYTVADPETAYLEITPRTHVANIYVDLGIPAAGGQLHDRVVPVVPLHIEATDAGNSALFALPTVDYCAGIANTHYLRVHLSGESDTIRLYLDAAGTVISHPELRVNVTQPFHVSMARVALLIVLVVLFQLFRPSSVLYRRPYAKDKGPRVLAMVLVAACEIAVVVVVVSLLNVHSTADTEPAPAPGTVIISDFNHYNYMAGALLAGKAEMDLPVASALNDLENPYDFDARMAALEQAGQSFYLDFVYYDGAYYSYFGVLPAALVFAPFKLIFGHDLSTARAVSLFCVLFVIALTLFLDRLFRRVAPKGSMGMFLLGDLSIFAGCGALYSAYLPQTYSIPIMSGLFFALLGLWFWLGARPRATDSLIIARGAAIASPLGTTGGLGNVSSSGTTGHLAAGPAAAVPPLRLSVGHLIAGAISIGLTLGCRPQFILVAFLALPLFWTEITENRLFFSRRGIGNTIAVILPIILVAIPFMLFNYVRFGSLTDFGASYNLTGADMTSRGIMLSRFPVCLFEFLFQPLNIVPAFPYIQALDMTMVDYQGFYFFEPFMGGFFMFSPIAFFIVLLFTKRRDLPSLIVRLGGVMALFALIVVAADLQIASITMRYFGDFGWYILVPAWMAIWYLWGDASAAPARRGAWSMTGLLVAIAALGFFENFWCLLCDGRYAPLMYSCPTLYYTLQSWLSIFN